jgi:hypothetical protein
MLATTPPKQNLQFPGFGNEQTTVTPLSLAGRKLMVAPIIRAR